MAEIRIMPMKIVTARKARLCGHCGHLISKGERYEMHRGFDSDRRPVDGRRGAWIEERRHIACPGHS